MKYNKTFRKKVIRYWLMKRKYPEKSTYEKFNIPRRTLRNWINKYKQNGMKGLNEGNKIPFRFRFKGD